jgi:hypothetical protein
VLQNGTFTGRSEKEIAFRIFFKERICSFFRLILARDDAIYNFICYEPLNI